MARPCKVGILGLTNPGIAIWDKANVEGRMEFPGLVEQAKKFVPELKAMGCDVVVISAHSGADTSSSYGDALPYPENASTLVAQQVPDVDAILVGHAHVDIPMREVVNEQTGKTVVLCEPFFWAKRVARFDITLKRLGRGWRVAGTTSTTLPTNTVDADPDVAAAVQEQHDIVVTYVNSVVGTSAVAMSAARAVVEDVPIIDFINFVQADAVKAALTGADAAPAGPVGCRAVQPGRVVPGGQRDDPRRGRPLHLRQHPARREAHRGPGEGLPGVLHAVLQGRSPVPAPSPSPTSPTPSPTPLRRRTARRTTTSTSWPASTRR